MNTYYLTALDEQFKCDCKVINLSYEYPGYTGKEKWAIITDLTEEELIEKYEEIISSYAKEKEEAKAEGREPELLPHFSCHHLRHTFCTRFCENETNLKVIQEIMGHADITTTMDIYNEATKDKKMESFAGLEGKIKIR